jgi:predicted enzyme related to lactoylglutathione lyase
LLSEDFLFMPQVTQHPAGSPCWFELGTTDQNGAKAFYSQMFGWTALEFPMGPGGTYTLFQLGGKDVAGGYKLMPEQQQQNIPPHWLVYFNTTDCDATAAKAVELGGAIVKPPMDVMALGRMAVLQDREKAVFALWEARMHIGAGVVQDIGSVGWSELAARDSAAAVAFYSELFGWKTAPSKNAPTQYTEFAVNGGEQMGGILQMNEEWEGMPSHWGIYIMVEDCEASAVKAKQLGGKVCHGPFEAGDVGWIAILADPQGAMLSIIQLKTK